MLERLADPALIAVLGVTVVMIALFILMVAIMLLTRLFPGKNGEIEMPKVMEGDEPTKETIAAIAVAMALTMREKEAGNISEHGESPVSGPVVSLWSAAGRERLMGSRRKTEHKWGKPSR